MYRLHLTRNLRSLAFLLVMAAVLAGIGTLWWANRTGLPESWRVAIEREISKQGAHVQIGGLSIHPLRGVVASNVHVYADPEHTHEISRLEQVILNFDKTKLARGIVHITRVELKDAALLLPVDPNQPTGEALDINHVNGIVFIPGNQRIEVRNATGFIAGVQINLNAKVIGYQQQKTQPTKEVRAANRRILISRITEELDKWHFDRKSPPLLQLFIEGDMNTPSSVVAKLSLRARGMEKNGHTLDEVSAEAQLAGDLLTVTSIHAEDTQGTLDGHLDYDFGDREGRFDLRSSLEIQPLLQAWLGLPPINDINIAGTQTFDSQGEFLLDEENIPKFHMTGRVHCKAVTLKGIPFDSVESSYAWRNGDLFLRDARFKRPDGMATGKVMIQWPLVRIALDSTLPAQLYKPLFVGKPLEIVIDDFKERPGANIHIKLEGGFDATDSTSWAYTGSGTVKNINYKGVPVNHADCSFSLNHHELDFHDGTITFNYQNYPLREAFGGPREGTAKVGRIRYDAKSKTVGVENVAGTVWAAPLVRLFAPKVADSLEEYRFHKPPELKGSGVVDVTPQGRTELDISFKSDDAADYKFLGQNLNLAGPSGNVLIRDKRIAVENLEFSTFEGPVAARFDYPGNGKLEGEMNWTRLSIPALASTYQFDMKGGGRITGRIQFDMANGKVETMNGDGLFALDKTELFSVPMFGPLSPLIGGVLGNRQAGFERAKEAFCNFKIKDGILSTNDFTTSTTSLVFVAEGSVDLKARTIDMIMRLNARGLLGFLTLPFRPFYHMFQFRGTGPLNDTKWENMIFTAPGGQQEKLLMNPPKAKVVGQD